ncbi:MAG: hypothetical protein CVV03_12655 [Firmicutes bacterium HGW-Firmicutes-8]|nr:MAG: hypothetical protein CVV03_12655 [Firmicutes bacterium HGW-Firmicutes-8]
MLINYLPLIGTSIILGLLAFWIPYIPMIAAGILFPIWFFKKKVNPFLSLSLLCISAIVGFGITPFVLSADQIYVMGGDSIRFPEGAFTGIIAGVILSGVFYIVTSIILVTSPRFFERQFIFIHIRNTQLLPFKESKLIHKTNC